MTSLRSLPRCSRPVVRRFGLFVAATFLIAFAVSPMAIAAKTDSGSLAIKAIKVGSKASPLRLTIQAPGSAELAVRVNGKSDDDDAFVSSDRHIRTLDLTASNGLRFGLNRIVVTSTMPDGSSKVRKRAVRISPRTHLADAGRDLSVRNGTTAIVGTRTAGLTGDADGRRLHWRIVKAPRGAKPKVRGANRMRVRLQTRRPGLYLLRLTSIAPGGRRSHDTVELNVLPKDPPIGVSLNTKKDGGNSIVIDGATLPGTRGPAGVAWAFLDRETRVPVPGASGTARTTAELDALIGKANDKSNTGNLMIVTAQAGVPTPQDVFRITVLLRTLDTEGTTKENEDALEQGAPFSFVGIVKGIAGSSRTLFPAFPYKQGAPGNISGLLQFNLSTGKYDLVRPEHPEFNTHATGSTPTRNVMTVGGVTYPGQQLPADASGGVHLVVLDRQTLELKRNQTFPLGTTPRDTDFWVTLRGALDERSQQLILLQTIGAPTPRTGEWDEMTRQIERLGGNRFLWLNLDGTNNYAIVGRRDAERPIAENGSAQDNPNIPRSAGTLAGALTMTRTSAYEPLLAGETPSSINTDIIDVTYQRSQPWPEFVSDPSKRDEAKLAEKYIATALGFCAPPISSCDMRVNYYNARQADWQGKRLTLNTGRELKWSADRFPGVSQGVYEAVKDQLDVELGMITNVEHYFDRLKEPFVTSSAASQVDLAAMSQRLFDNAQIPPNTPTTSWALGLVGKIIGIGNFASGLTRQVSAGVSASFMLGSYLTSSKGTPVAGAQINAKTSDIAERLTSEMLASIDALDTQTQLVISDWGKLKAADYKVDHDWALPPTSAQAIKDMRQAAGQTIAEALIPAAVPHLIRATPGLANGRALDCGTILKWGHYWFKDLPDSSQMYTVDGRYPDGSAYKTFFLLNYVQRSQLPDALAKSLFAPIADDPRNLGIEKLSFFSKRVFGRILHADTGNNYCGLNEPDRLGDAYFRGL